MPSDGTSARGSPEPQWLIDIYNLTYAGFILTGGTLGDLFGRRRIFVVGTVLFNVRRIPRKRSNYDQSVSHIARPTSSSR